MTTDPDPADAVPTPSIPQPSQPAEDVTPTTCETPADVPTPAA